MSQEFCGFLVLEINSHTNNIMLSEQYYVVMEVILKSWDTVPIFCKAPAKNVTLLASILGKLFNSRECMKSFQLKKNLVMP